jgi:hypothetical protein
MAKHLFTLQYDTQRQGFTITYKGTETVSFDPGVLVDLVFKTRDQAKEYANTYVGAVEGKKKYRVEDFEIETPEE